MNDAIEIYTIGFTKKSAEEFFTKLREAGVARIVDIRLQNTSQLAGFAKSDNLQYFLKQIAGIGYVHLPELAPTGEILAVFKKEKGDWAAYEAAFLKLLESRRVEETVSRETLDRGCLLCSEDTPEHCHRRLVAEYFARHWGTVQVTHL